MNPELAWADSNRDFYDRMEVDYLRRAADWAGLQASPDVEHLWPRVGEAESLLEIGAGYGRVLGALICRGFRGRLVAVERSPHFVRALHERFGERVEVRQGEGTSAAAGEQFDVVLWLWSGITEFPRAEQAAVVRQALARVKPGGTLVLEAPELGSANNATVNFGQRAIVNASFGTLRVYIPTEEQMREHAGSDASVRALDYRTGNGRGRVLYIYEKRVFSAKEAPMFV